MKCSYCNKEIKHDDNYELFGYDGGFIHKECIPKMQELIREINFMSDEEFINWIQGLN